MVRYKARYLLFNILYPNEPSSNASDKPIFSHPSDSSLSRPLLTTLLRDALILQFGDHGGGLAGSLNVKYFSPVTSTGIVKVPRDHYRMVWAAMTFIKEVRGRPAVMRVVRVSGTIKKAQEEAIRRAKEEVRRAGADAGVSLAVEDVMDLDEGEEEEED